MDNSPQPTPDEEEPNPTLTDPAHEPDPVGNEEVQVAEAVDDDVPVITFTEPLAPPEAVITSVSPDDSSPLPLISCNFPPSL